MGRDAAGAVTQSSENRNNRFRMESVGIACVAFAAAAFLAQVVSVALAAWRCRKGRKRVVPLSRPAVSLVRPLSGLEPYSAETLHSTFDIAYPSYEILLCVADKDDPIVPLVRGLIARYPDRPATLLIGKDALGANPKLNNMAKGFRAARFDHVVFTDSNVLLPVDYLDQIMAALQRGAGMVSAPPVGQAPEGFWAELECAFLNSYQARIQYAVDTLGFGFAQGKTLFFRRGDLEHGGLARLASEPAEDAAATKMMRAMGKRIRLAGPFAQLIGRRSFAQVWQRQVRWARLRKASFPMLFGPEILAGAVPPVLALGLGLGALDLPWLPGSLLFMGLWYLSELVLLRVAGWPRSLLAILLRDLLLPAVYLAGLMGSGFEWHGQKLQAESQAPDMDNVRRKPQYRLGGYGDV